MKNDPIQIQIDDVQAQVQEAHDFEWLRTLGRVVAVFDQQDSGNISFGVEKSGAKRFVKYAGAKAVTFSGEPRDAVQRLKAAVPVFQELRHPALVELVDHFEVNGDGYAAVFHWFKGESLHNHWMFPPPAKYTDPRSPNVRFQQLPLEDRLRAVDTIYSFHAHVERLGYVAIDFYDGSLLYDFDRRELKICDIDLYERKPFINTMGRLWGSSRFMAPEEFELGATIDERTNVFNMGATAFVLLGGERDRALAKWTAGEALYEVALKAVDPDRERRFASVAAFKAAWDAGKAECGGANVNGQDR
ncbi:serine/threonine protein kinase [Paenibacillus koleovorans]|uniref:serine/threonine protein kinase n=1 Tax=Paenibacillus koleovorans TaxID=121608 RepID=UPI000FD79FA4|nr:serine/threonine protein kinase [Paenibacillus koleovorans]